MNVAANVASCNVAENVAANVVSCNVAANVAANVASCNIAANVAANVSAKPRNQILCCTAIERRPFRFSKHYKIMDPLTAHFVSLQ